ncbi:hypothetical protein [Marinobacter alkaliphilus]|uniref:hypothetical protein n=1 Tax=Marinobacter alkaliphilus TaxID=254719 RepID=UPI003D80FBAE|nr:hypothetical protein PBN92_09215 [Marinobacter alkaliphilus]
MIPQIQKITAGILVALALALSSLVNASPRISSVDGEVRDGSTLTLNGSGFSSMNTGRILYDLVSNQTEYDTLSSGSAVPVDEGPWSQGTNVWGNPLTIITSGDLRTPNATAAYYGEVKAYVGWPRVLSNTNNDTLYVSWWYNPNQLANNGGSNKYIRIWDRSDGTGTRISLTQMHMTYNGTNGDLQTSWGTTQPDANRWNRFELYVDSRKNSITASLNGRVVQNVKDFQKAASSEGLTVALIGFDPSENDRYPNYAFRMKDIYVSTNQARVELSTSNTWDPSSRREVLNPIEWSDEKLTVSLSYFSHKPSEALYLYVFDSDGNTNTEGFPLCEKCPGRPEGVRVD